MKTVLSKYQYHWKQKRFRLSLMFGVSFFILSLLFNHQASLYAEVRASNPVTDILLDNLPVVDVDGFLNYGVMTFSLFVIYILFIEPKKIPFFLKSLSTFILIRAAFITLTHLGPVPLKMAVNPNDLLAQLILGNDYFFSGHTGIPFLIALIFWKDKLVRYIAILASCLFGASVILGHYHYSIDVFAAFFITYAIFHISQKIFLNDYELFGKEADFERGKA